jgi:hypothetical protein
MSAQKDLRDGETAASSGPIESGPGPGQFVTIGRYQDTLEAEMAKTRLQSAGIAGFLNGEEASHLYGTGMGMLQLQVAAEDEADARAIVNDPGMKGPGEPATA